MPRIRSVASATRRMADHPISQLPALDDDGIVHVVIDTPRGSRNKYAFEPALGMFALRHVLPAGASFPFDFGFVPGTRSEDGDALDVLVLLDDPTFTGCLVRVRPVGVIEAEETHDGQTQRNDRVIAVAVDGRAHRDVRELRELDTQTLDDVERFFVSYNDARGRDFRPLGRHGAERAQDLLDAAIARER